MHQLLTTFYVENLTTVKELGVWCSLFLLQIYKLMKEDSYSRFKASQLYKDAVVAEMEGRPFVSEGNHSDVKKVVKS